MLVHRTLIDASQLVGSTQSHYTSNCTNMFLKSITPWILSLHDLEMLINLYIFLVSGTYAGKAEKA